MTGRPESCDQLYHDLMADAPALPGLPPPPAAPMLAELPAPGDVVRIVFEWTEPATFEAEHELTAGQCDQMRAAGRDPFNLSDVFEWLMEDQDRASWDYDAVRDSAWFECWDESLISASVVPPPKDDPVMRIVR